MFSSLSTTHDACRVCCGPRVVLKILVLVSCRNESVCVFQEARDAYYMKNYPDWFQTVGKTLVRKESDGTFVALSDDEMAELRRKNLLTFEIPKSMGGRVIDYTQKPVLILKDQ